MSGRPTTYMLEGRRAALREQLRRDACEEAVEDVLEAALTAFENCAATRPNEFHLADPDEAARLRAALAVAYQRWVPEPPEEGP